MVVPMHESRQAAIAQLAELENGRVAARKGWFEEADSRLFLAIAVLGPASVFARLEESTIAIPALLIGLAAWLWLGFSAVRQSRRARARPRSFRSGRVGRIWWHLTGLSIAIGITAALTVDLSGRSVLVASACFVWLLLLPRACFLRYESAMLNGS